MNTGIVPDCIGTNNQERGKVKHHSDAHLLQNQPVLLFCALCDGSHCFLGPQAKVLAKEFSVFLVELIKGLAAISAKKNKYSL